MPVFEDFLRSTTDIAKIYSPPSNPDFETRK